MDIEDGLPINDLDDAAALIGELDLDGEEAHDGDTEGEAEPQGEDDPEGADGGDNEPRTAIEAPASLNAEEKARFAQLPEEAQRLLTEVETRRNGQVQAATSKAAEAQRTAEANAAQANAQAKAVYAQQLKAFAANMAPQRPDPSLAHTDPATYIALNAQYDAAKAQHDDFVQQVQALDTEARTEFSQAEVAERDRFLMTIPEVQNTDTREAFFKKAIEIAGLAGFSGDVINRASGPELKFLREVHGWKEKAEKYDSAMSRQMQRVREGGKKQTAMKPNPSNGERRRGFSEARDRLRNSGSLDDAAAAIARLG